jgi:adenylyltransferase/sulfurtransferase
MAPSCAEGGVLGVLPGTIALIQATETIKLVTGMGEPLVGRLLQYDALGMSFTEFRIRKDPKCPVCGENPTIQSLIDYEGFCGTGSAEPALAELSAAGLRELLERGEKLLLLDVRRADEYAQARIEGSRLIPLGELAGRLDEIAAHRDGLVVVHCHVGGRSAQACRFLAENGFRRVRNLAGGIEAWSLTVDPRVPRY